MLKRWIKHIPPSVTRGVRSMATVTTVVFGVAMALMGFALWETTGATGWVSGWSIAVGVMALVAAAVIFKAPHLWRLTALSLAVPVFVTIGIGIAAAIDVGASPGAGGLSPDRMVVGLAIGSLCLVWVAFIATALVRTHRDLERRYRAGLMGAG